MRRLLTILIWAAAAALVAFVGFAAYVRLAPVPDGQDPLAAQALASPNWALAASDGIETAAEATHRLAVFAAPPDKVLDAVARVALAEDRTEQVGAGESPLRRDFVQRSALMGYPDLISAQAAPLPPGADGAPRTGLAIFSRSVYGYSDMGVNAARLDRWIAALNDAL